MPFGIIATWRMAYEAVNNQIEQLKNGQSSGDVLETAIQVIEDYENFISVGYGGLPNEEGVVQLDAAYMDGNTLEFGAVAGMEGVANPIAVARKLSKERFNSMRVGHGAKKYALEQGFKEKNLLSSKARELFQERSKKIASKELTSYDGTTPLEWSS